MIRSHNVYIYAGTKEEEKGEDQYIPVKHIPVMRLLNKVEKVIKSVNSCEQNGLRILS